jgi:hypothetical protein
MPLNNIYKVLREKFTDLTALDQAHTLAIYIKMIGAKLLLNIGSYSGSPKTPTELNTAFVDLDAAHFAYVMDSSKENEDTLNGLITDTIEMLRLMANFVDETAAGSKTLVQLIGFTATDPSTTSVGAPLQAQNPEFTSKKGVLWKLFYKFRPVKNLSATVLVSSATAGIVPTVQNPNQLVVRVPPSTTETIINVNVFTAHETEIDMPSQTGKLSGTSFGMNSSGFSPASTPTPVTIPN